MFPSVVWLNPIAPAAFQNTSWPSPFEQMETDPEIA